MNNSGTTLGGTGTINGAVNGRNRRHSAWRHWQRGQWNTHTGEQSYFEFRLDHRTRSGSNFWCAFNSHAYVESAAWTFVTHQAFTFINLGVRTRNNLQQHHHWLGI